MRRVVGYILLAALICALTGLFCASVSAEAANVGATCELKFDKDSYVPGETAAVNIVLTDLEELTKEVPNALLGAFQVYVKPAGALTYKEGSIGENIVGGDVAEVKETSERSGVYVAVYSSPTGSTIKEGMILATLKFTVADAAENSVAVSFAEGYDNAAMLPYDGKLTIKQPNGKEINKVLVLKYKDASAEVVDYVLSDKKAEYSGDVVSGGITVRKANENKVVLIAALYDKTSKLLKASPIIKDVTEKQTKFTSSDISFSGVLNPQNSEIHYFLWNSVSGMKNLCGKVVAETASGS